VVPAMVAIWKVFAATLLTTNGPPLMLVLPVAPAMKTASPLDRPCAVEVMTVGVALVAAVMVPCRPMSCRLSNSKPPADGTIIAIGHPHDTFIPCLRAAGPAISGSAQSGSPTSMGSEVPKDGGQDSRCL
jgi:hypothetical protein